MGCPGLTGSPTSSSSSSTTPETGEGISALTLSVCASISVSPSSTESPRRLLHAPTVISSAPWSSGMTTSRASAFTSLIVGRSGGPAQPRPAGSSHHRPIRWYETQLTAVLHDLPAALVYLAVMVVAEQDQVAQLGLSATRPELDVMRLRPAGRPLAARPPTAPVAQAKRAMCGAAYDTRRPPDVDHDRVRHHDTRDCRVASQALHRAGRNRQGVLEVGGGRAGQVPQAVQRGRHRKVRPDPVAAPEAATVQGVERHLAERVRHPLPVAALVPSSKLARQSLEGRFQRRTTLGVEQAFDRVHAVGHLGDAEAPLAVGLF